jgi:hypothetical protein
MCSFYCVHTTNTQPYTLIHRLSLSHTRTHHAVPEQCTEEMFVDLVCTTLGMDRDSVGFEDHLDAFDRVMDW